MTVLLMFLWGWQNAAKGYQMTVDVSEYITILYKKDILNASA